ncbi:RNase P subunit p30 family protein [Methanofollis fontis]|uniref:Ribonuclease P protein component 3 n=1 Tax=Methanofollis fontis TaxID=2052832 RepID=A0A483CRL0_9EURY|nr:RNase P subunit p30 family protein [Methanofollis fontis]TAJ43664.1 ribonuclease P [Methanofollis fontis]
MAYADACVHPYPSGDSSLPRMALEARECGYSIIVSDVGEGEFYGVRAVRGVIVRERTAKDAIRAVRRAPDDAIVSVCAGDAGFTRSMVSFPGVHILKGVHLAGKFAFDHVAARTAAEKGVCVEIDLAPIIAYRGRERQRVLACYADILHLQRRYGFGLCIGSNARSVLGQRSVREASGLCSLFGMREEECIAAFSSVEGLLEPSGPVRVVP